MSDDTVWTKEALEGAARRMPGKAVVDEAGEEIGRVVDVELDETGLSFTAELDADGREIKARLETGPARYLR